jgi:transposase
MISIAHPFRNVPKRVGHPATTTLKTEAQRDQMALLLQTEPGVGAITALMGDVSRFPRGKQVAAIWA